MFNSLRYTKSLEEAGVARKQAEAHVEILSDMMASHFATTHDLKDLRTELSQKMEDLHTEFRSVRKDVAHDIAVLRSDMHSLEMKLTIRLGTLITVLISLGFGSLALLLKLT